MNKKGFTLVELLVVIVILSVIVVIAVPSINAITQSIKDNMIDKKAKLIEESAILLGDDIKGSIIASDKKYNNFPCKSFIVSDLVPNYLDKDNDNSCLGKDSEETVGCIVDPSDENNYLDKYEIIIYYKNKRMYAKLDTKNNLECS